MALENARKRIQFIQSKITPQQLVDVGFPIFVENTPVRTGNARKQTKKNSQSIIADYPYAGPLDRGRSKQRPNGMTKPTVKAMQDYVKKTLG